MAGPGCFPIEFRVPSKFRANSERIPGKFRANSGQTPSKHCVFPFEPQSPNDKDLNLQKKWGFRRFQKECQKVRKTTLFCALIAQKGTVFHTFGHSFWNRRKPHFFCRLVFLPFWALRLDRKYTKQASQTPSISLSSEPPKRGRKTGAARKLSESVENISDAF